jgi:plasmid stabilization system protein ParE
MTYNNHPITPPPELVKQWLAEFYGPESMPGMAPGEMVLHVAAVAARWGADQELEACIEWLGESPVIWHGDPEEHPGSYLREARRPKLKSQAEEALDLINRIEYNAMTKNSGNEKAWDLEELEGVRRALKRLQELEKHDD